MVFAWPTEVNPLLFSFTIYACVYDNIMEDIFSILTRHLQDPETGWSIGTFGALAEFHWEPDEIKKIILENDFGRVVTARGAIEIQRHRKLRLIPYETISTIPNAWSQGVMVCLPQKEAAFKTSKGVTEIRAGFNSLMPKLEGRLFDLGFEFPHIKICVRTTDPNLSENLTNATGSSFLALRAETIKSIKAANPVRVFRSQIGCIEVSQKIPDSKSITPTGPHTHVLPALLKQNLDHASNIPIPDGWTVVAAFYPAHPVRNKDGSLKAFDQIAFKAFQELIDNHAPVELAEAKHEAWQLLRRSVPPNINLMPKTRHARTAFRVALRQWEHLHTGTINSNNWRKVCDPTRSKKVIDLRPPHGAEA